MSTLALNDAITSALQSWTQGQQQAAIDVLRPHADAGERSAVLLLAWFFSQMGQPFWSDGLAYAKKAVELGVPQVATYYRLAPRRRSIALRATSLSTSEIDPFPTRGVESSRQPCLDREGRP